MYNQEIEDLIDAALADGMLTEKEKQILFKKAQAMGVDLDEFEMVLDARLVKLKKAEQEKAASSAPKSNKLGDVKKCPACGAIVQSYQGVCPECGYAFEGMDANSAVKELSSLLQKTSEQDKMEKLIDTYPIPMEKASLLAFITWLRPQSTDTNNPLSNTYFKKYAECVNKIRVSFSNDKDLQQFIGYFESDTKYIKKKKLVKLTLKNKWFWIAIAILFVLILILKPKPMNKSSERTMAAIQKEIKNNNPEKAEELLVNYCGDKKKKVFETASSIITEYLSSDNEEGALRIAHFLGIPNNSWSLEGYEESAADALSDYYINHGRYEESLSIEGGWIHKDRLQKVIASLCKEGNKKQAQRIVEQYIGEVVIYNLSGKEEEAKRKEIKKEFLSFINNY